MALDYRKCAEEIFANLGGKENIISTSHCATRLRLVIADNNKINPEALEKVDGVKGTFYSNGQLQVIIGPGTVNKVYDEFLAITGLTAASREEVKEAAVSRMPLWRQILKVPGDVFVPILPAIVASGLMMGIVEGIPGFWPAFQNTDWFAFLDMVSNTAFTLLPVLVAISAARVFGGNLFLGAVIGMMMVHPALLNAWEAGNPDVVNRFFGIETGVIPVWHLFCFRVPQVGYQGHVIPVILAVFMMAAIEKWLHKKVPEMIDLFVTPLVTVLLTSFITFTIIGPLFSIFENGVLTAAKWLITVGHGAGAAFMGALYPWTVVMGLHHMYNVIEAGMLSVKGGLNTWMPIASAANFAQFGACLAVAVKARNGKTRSAAFPSALSASLGITEPAIFGINFRFLKPFLCGMAGGAAGSLFAAWFGFGAATYGVTGIPGIPAVSNVPMYLAELFLASGIAFALTWIFWKEGTLEGEAASENPSPSGSGSAEKHAAASVIRCANGVVLQPVKGKVIPYHQIPDDTFASGMLGVGVGIVPEEEIVTAPFDGIISSVAESSHAIGIESNGMELLIHVGVDTVKMQGDGFTCLAQEGDMVKAGQPLIRFSREKIRAAGFSDMVAVLLTNSDELEDVEYGTD